MPLLRLLGAPSQNLRFSSGVVSYESYVEYIKILNVAYGRSFPGPSAQCPVPSAMQALVSAGSTKNTA